MRVEISQQDDVTTGQRLLTERPDGQQRLHSTPGPKNVDGSLVLECAGFYLIKIFKNIFSLVASRYLPLTGQTGLQRRLIEKKIEFH